MSTLRDNHVMYAPQHTSGVNRRQNFLLSPRGERDFVACISVGFSCVEHVYVGDNGVRPHPALLDALYISLNFSSISQETRASLYFLLSVTRG